jgi:hypothetical protein
MGRAPNRMQDDSDLERAFIELRRSSRGPAQMITGKVSGKGHARV